MASISPHPPHPSASATPSSSTLVDGPGPSSGRPDRSEKSERRQPAASPTHPRILIFSSMQRKLSSLSPFQRREGCDRFGKVVRCEKLRDGGIEVEFQSEKDAERALRATECTYTAKTGNTRQQEQLPITVSAHRTKNSTRGIVFCPDLEGMDDEEIADGLSQFGVTHARRIMSRKDGALVPTHNVVLTFDGLDLPREVTVGYVVVKVRQYIPSPMRCFNCLRFGHTRDSCRNQPTCSKCSAGDHLSKECESEDLKCVNCDKNERPHSALDPKCPALLKEKEILTIKFTHRLSFRDARERYNASHPTRSYANVASEKGPANQATTDQHSNIRQLISLLQAFGLQLVSTPGGPVLPEGPAPQQTAVERRTLSTQTSPPPSPEPPRADAHPLTSALSPTHGQGSAARKETAVTAALRRNQEQRQEQDARRALVIERALAARQSPTLRDQSGESALAAPPAPAAGPPAMGPPPLPPPPPPRPRDKPPAPPTSPLPGGGQSDVASSSSSVTELPPTPGRPGKRNQPWSSSPSDGEAPRSRVRVSLSPGGARSSSADGRLVLGKAAHPRVQFANPRSEGGSEERL